MSKFYQNIVYNLNKVHSFTRLLVPNSTQSKYIFTVPPTVSKVGS